MRTETCQTLDCGDSCDELLQEYPKQQDCLLENPQSVTGIGFLKRHLAGEVLKWHAFAAIVAEVEVVEVVHNVPLPEMM